MPSWLRRVSPRLALRQLASDPTVVSTILVAVVLSTIVLASTPLLFEELENEAVQAALSKPVPSQRNIQAQRIVFLSSGPEGDPFNRVSDASERFTETNIPESIASIIGSQRWVLDSPQFVVSAFPGEDGPTFDSRFRFRYQEAIEEHLTLSAGSLPVLREPVPLLTGPECPDPGTEAADLFIEEPDEDLDCIVDEVPLHEAAVSAATLGRLGVGVGGRFILEVDATDPLYRRLAGDDRRFRLVLEISGVVGLSPSTEAFWYGDDRLHDPPVAQNADFTTVFATGVMAPADYGPLVRDVKVVPWLHTYRLFVDPAAVDSGKLDELRADLLDLESRFARFSVAVGEFTVNTGLSQVLADFVAERQSTVTLLAISVAGVAVVALAVVALLAALIEARQRSGVLLVRNRGSSRVRLLFVRVTQGLILSVPPVGLGYVIARLAASDADPEPARQIAVALIIGTTAAVVAAASRLIARDLGRLQLEDGSRSARTRRRLVLEGFVVAVAIGVVVLLRRRGAAGAEEVGSIDPLLALAPAILGAAVGLATVRLIGFPVRLLAWLSARRRGPVVFVGLRRVVRQVSAAELALVVVLLAVGTAVFSSIVRQSVDEGQQDSTWQETGAAYRFTAGSPASALSSRLDLAVLEEIEATAVGTRLPAAKPLGEALVVPSVVDLLLLDLAAYQRVVDSTPADVGLPPELFDSGPTPLGTVESPIPVIASRQWGERSPIPGDLFTVNLGRAAPVFVVAAVREQFPSMPLDGPFAIADSRAVAALEGQPVLLPTVVYARASGDADAEIRTVVASQSRAVRVASQSASYRDLRESPFVRGVNRALGAGFGLAALFAIVGAVSTMALTAAQRRRDLGYLRTMGLTSRQAVGVTIVEQLPALAVGVVAGILLGIGTVSVFEPALDLVPFAGPRIQSTTQIDGMAITLVGAGLLIVMASAVGIFGWVSRHEQLGMLLRLGDE